ncbi:hypothetical protein C8F01DRAFT_1238175 [Mycena amicta]|nr:hypothetical protein C8F01DRAFT_1238175 [Mycena amicta]
MTISGLASASTVAQGVEFKTWPCVCSWNGLQLPSSPKTTMYRGRAANPHHDTNRKKTGEKFDPDEETPESASKQPRNGLDKSPPATATKTQDEKEEKIAHPNVVCGEYGIWTTEHNGSQKKTRCYCRTPESAPKQRAALPTGKSSVENQGTRPIEQLPRATKKQERTPGERIPNPARRQTSVPTRIPHHLYEKEEKDIDGKVERPRLHRNSGTGIVSIDNSLTEGGTTTCWTTSTTKKQRNTSKKIAHPNATRSIGTRSTDYWDLERRKKQKKKLKKQDNRPQSAPKRRARLCATGNTKDPRPNSDARRKKHQQEDRTSECDSVNRQAFHELLGSGESAEHSRSQRERKRRSRHNTPTLYRNSARSAQRVIRQEKEREIDLSTNHRRKQEDESKTNKKTGTHWQLATWSCNINPNPTRRWVWSAFGCCIRESANGLLKSAQYDSELPYMPL